MTQIIITFTSPHLQQVYESQLTSRPDTAQEHNSTNVDNYTKSFLNFNDFQKLQKKKRACPSMYYYDADLCSWR